MGKDHLTPSMSATLQRTRSKSGAAEDDVTKPTRMRRGTSFGCGSREEIHNNPDPSLPTQYVRKDSRTKVVEEQPPRNIPRTVSKFNAQFGPAPPPPGPAVVQKITNMRRTRSDPAQMQSRVLPILEPNDDKEDSKPVPVKRTVSLAMGFQKIPEDWNALPTISEGMSMGSSELVNRSLKAINNYGDDDILPPPDEEDEIAPPVPTKRTSKPFDASVKVPNNTKGKDAVPYAQKPEEPGRSRLKRTNSKPEANARIQFPPAPPDEPVPPSYDEYHSPHSQPEPPPLAEKKKKRSIFAKLFGRGKSTPAAPEKPAGLAKSKTATEGVSREKKLEDYPRTKTLAEDGSGGDALPKSKSKSFFKKTKSFAGK
eukprot:c9557_g1_i1.p1 GENE.c9557_g1_i1~~c9557_g1_i1.p1  ORF type:complete len:369 (+),score=59.25 c9557_g1_i1:2-1108(+)